MYSQIVMQGSSPFPGQTGGLWHLCQEQSYIPCVMTARR
jgi:hypothetical protein